jgi:Ca2+-binding EF-hand superfamily protein
MKIPLLCPVALALFAASLTAQPSGQPKAPATPKDAYDLVFLSESRPLLVRVDIRVDGKPLEVVWNQFIDYLFKYTDTNGDGVLSREEAERAPQPNMFSATFLFGGFGMGANATLKGADKSGKVTRAEFAQFYRNSGLAPFHVHARSDNKKGPARGMPFAMRDPPPAELSRALMKLLDTDKDGKLSRQELAAAPALLRKLDLDEDEVITPKELLPDFTNLDAGFAAAVYREVGEARGPAVGNETVFLVTPATSSREVAQRLLSRYGAKKGKKALTRADMGLDAESFAQLDRDGNGELDGEELARFLPRSPDLEFVIRIGDRKPTEQVVELVRHRGKDVRLTRSVDTATLLVGGDRLGVRVGEAKPRAQLGALLRTVLEQQFTQADRDNNGYIDEKEAQRSGFRQTFKMMDRDGDGKLYLKEVLAYFESVEDFQTRATVSCVSLVFTDGGKGLFDLFDADRDGRLSLREVNALVKLVDELDRNGDGAIGADEIPHSYLFRFDQGTGGEANNPFAVFEALGMQSGPLPPRGRGPLWFQKMDRNRDGDVSRREWLGSEELFRRIDTDGDGLISLEEALRFEESLRKGGQQKR